MSSLVERARQQPGEDILGMLVREHGTELTDDELIGIAGLLLLAGHETTSNMLGLGTLALLRHPDQLAAVRDDPDAVGPAVEELLRWLSIVHTAIPRITTTDVEIAGVPIPAGRAGLRVAAVGQPRPGLHRLDRRCSTSAAARQGIWRSATACTTAWALRWPAWRCGSRSRRCCADSRRWRWPRTSPMCRSGRFTSSTV